MSEESKITSVVKTKDPRRVEAGKRLGMISKQAKERKALRLEGARSTTVAQTREQSEAEAKEKNDDWFPPIGSIGSPVVGIGFVGLVGLALYYAYVKKYKTVIGTKGDDASHVKTEEAEAVSEATSKTKPKRVYKELDTLD